MYDFVGGSANGDRPSMGELTVVASAKRAVLGDFKDGALLTVRLEFVDDEVWVRMGIWMSLLEKESDIMIRQMGGGGVVQLTMMTELGML
jgi:hypothetical protein